MLSAEQTDALRLLGRSIKAHCPPGVGFALFVDGLYLATGDRGDVRTLISGWLEHTLGPSRRSSDELRDGESASEHASRLVLEEWCAKTARGIVFDARALILFVFDFEPRNADRLAWRALGDEALILRMLREFVGGGMS